MARIVVYGYGNTLRGDDGLGPEAVSRLEKRLTERHIEFRTAHQLLPEDAEFLSTAEQVFFIDAREGEVPGQIQYEEIKPESDAINQSNLHALTPAGILQLAGQCFGHTPRTYLYTVTGADFGYKQELSTVVQHTLPELIDRITARLEQQLPQKHRESTKKMYTDNNH